MKVIDTTLLATYKSRGAKIVVTVKIERTDGQIFRWISYDEDKEIEGETYESAPGVDLTSLVRTEGFLVDNAELKALDRDDAIIKKKDIYAGLWNSAKFTIGETNPKALAPVINELSFGKLGIWKMFNGYFTVEFRDVRQSIQNPHESVLQPTCRYQFGVRNAVSHCPIILGDVMVTGTLTSADSQSDITDTSRTEDPDWFGEGLVEITSGQNNGMPGKRIKTYEDGRSVLWTPFTYPLLGNETYRMWPGCRLRMLEDCRDKWDVIADFGGEYNSRTADTLTAPGTA